MNVADYLLECADACTNAIVRGSHQFSTAGLREVAARAVEGDHVGRLDHDCGDAEFFLLFCPKGKPQSVSEALHGIRAALRVGARRLEGQYQLPVIGKPTERRGSVWRT